MAKKKHKGGGHWIDELQISQNSVEEKEGTFSEDNSAEEIALELKRKAPDFQAAMGKITLYINRAGKRLTESRKKELNRVKDLLRDIYSRPDREKAQKRASANRIATNWVFDYKKGFTLDQFLPELVANEEEYKNLVETKNTNLKPHQLKIYKKWLLDLFNKHPHSQEEEVKVFEEIAKELDKRAQEGHDVPGFDPVKSEPMIIEEPDNVWRTPYMKNASEHLVFASEVQALQYLSDISNDKIVVSAANTKTFDCPNEDCDAQVLENTSYCVKCQKHVEKGKKKEASESKELVFDHPDKAIQHLADITGKKVLIAEQ
jgi:hypothetical protein